MRPQTTTVTDGHIHGTYLKRAGVVEYISAADWKDAPHVALANLKTYDKQGKANMEPEYEARIDEKAIQWFIRTYGVLDGGRKNREGAYISGQIHKLHDGRELFHRYADENDKPPEAGSFDQNIAGVRYLQYYLRLAWAGKSDPYDDPVSHIESAVMMDDSFKVSFDGPTVTICEYYKGDYREPSHYKFEKVVLATDDLSKLICYSFLRDFYAGKIGVCENPNCPARYYLKKRKDQKYCTGAARVERGSEPSADDGPDFGSCATYAQRKYARKWWHGNRQGKQAKKRIKSPRKKRK